MEAVADTEIPAFLESPQLLQAFSRESIIPETKLTSNYIDLRLKWSSSDIVPSVGADSISNL